MDWYLVILAIVGIIGIPIAYKIDRKRRYHMDNLAAEVLDELEEIAKSTKDDTGRKRFMQNM